MASVHELDKARARQPRSIPRPPTAPQEPATPDRAAALNMLGTFDLDGVDLASPDDVLAALDGSAAVSERERSPNHAPPDDRRGGVDRADVRDVDSDEILRELEEHHRRGHTAVRPSAPRGSAELQPSARRSAPRAPRRAVRNETSTGPKRRGRYKRATLFAAAMLALTIAASTAALSHIGGTASRATSRAGSGRLAAAAEIAPFVPIKIFGTLANLLASDAARIGRHHAAPVERRRRRRKRPTPPQRAVGYAAAAPVVSTTPTNSAPASSSSSSPPPASSSQAAASEPAPAASTQSTQPVAPAASTQATQPAFGQNGSLGPGRGAASTLPGSDRVQLPTYVLVLFRVADHLWLEHVQWRDQTGRDEHPWT